MGRQTPNEICNGMYRISGGAGFLRTAKGAITEEVTVHVLAKA